jgi:pimeloyl-[acyl-carrier protein] synthase
MSSAEPIVYNPYLPGVRADPYPHYAELRREAPVHWSPAGFWVVARYHDGTAILTDRSFAMTEPREWGNANTFEYEGAAFERVIASLSRMMLFKNPPDHTRLRGLVSKAFTARAVEGLRGRVREIVDELLSAVRESGRMDLIADLAYPLPAMVIAEMLGVPAEDRSRFRSWSRDLAPTIDPMILPDQLERAAAAIGEFTDYLVHLVAARRAEPRADLLSALIAAEERGDKLSQDELVSNAMLLLNAGHETTTNLIGNGTLALLRHPRELEGLRRDPGLLPGAIEELLRYDSPVQMTGRSARTERVVGGATIAPGQQVVVLVGSANHDSERFADPDRLDVRRGDDEHLSFGGGSHYCLGASLARLEAQVAIGAIVSELPKLRLATGEPEWRETLTLRGLKSLPVEF